MAKFTLYYARLVLLEREIEAKDIEAAWEEAQALESKGELGLKEILPLPGSRVQDIVDYEFVWEVQPEGR